MAVNPRPLLLTGVDVPWAARTEVNIDHGVVRATTQAHRRQTAHEVQLAPDAAIKIIPGVLKVSLEVSVTVVGHLEQPGVEIEARASILSARLDNKIAIQRVSELVRHAHAKSRHEEERVIEYGAGSAERAGIFEGVDGEIVAKSALHTVKVHHRRHSNQRQSGRPQRITHAGQPVIVS